MYAPPKGGTHNQKCFQLTEKETKNSIITVVPDMQEMKVNLYIGPIKALQWQHLFKSHLIC